MSGVGFNTERLDGRDVAYLEQLHRSKHLELAFTRGLAGRVALNGDPQALVDELLRLARLGALSEAKERR